MSVTHKHLMLAPMHNLVLHEAVNVVINPTHSLLGKRKSRIGGLSDKSCRSAIR